jgi:hypothetical protein
VKTLKFNKKITVTLPLLLILIATMAAAQTVIVIKASATPTPAIWTDKEDYSPEETVTIYGSGFSPSQTVTISIIAPNEEETIFTIYTASDQWGSFQTQYILDGMIGVYTVVATDQSYNQATTTFSDCNLQVDKKIVNPCENVTASAILPCWYHQVRFKWFNSTGGLVRSRLIDPFNGSGVSDTLKINKTDPLGRWRVELWGYRYHFFSGWAWEKIDKETFNVVVMKTYADAACTIERTTFNPGETVWVKAVGLPNGTYRFIWLDPGNITQRISAEITVATANNNGSVADSWNGAVALGEWTIKLQQKTWSGCWWDCWTCWKTVKITTFRVIPEVPIGVIISTLVMLGALGFVLIRKPKIR